MAIRKAYCLFRLFRRISAGGKAASSSIEVIGEVLKAPSIFLRETREEEEANIEKEEEEVREPAGEQRRPRRLSI